MTLHRIPPHPVVTDRLRERIASSVKLTFASRSGQTPGAKELQDGRFVFGVNTGWSVAEHDLEVCCELSEFQVAAELFGPSGLVCRDASLGLALEWTSSDTARRQITAPSMIRFPGPVSMEPIRFTLEIPAASVRGTVRLSLQLVVGKPGSPGKDERHLANVKGFRLGSVSQEYELVFEGDGSLFPITEEAGEASEALWAFRAFPWDDVSTDEFSSEYVTLAINSTHPAFAQLKGSSLSPYQTVLFRQVLASWLTLFLLKIKERAEHSQWRDIETHNGEAYLPGSIADAAAYLINVGALNTGSPETLMQSCQKWIDKACVAESGT